MTNSQLNPLMAEILNCHIKPIDPICVKQIHWSDDKKTFQLELVPESKFHCFGSTGTKTEPFNAEFLPTMLKEYGDQVDWFCDECGVFCDGRRSQHGYAVNCICEECEMLMIEDSRDIETVRLLNQL
jgi:hypothetical protein